MMNVRSSLDTELTQELDLVVVGGGLGGLVTASFVAQQGRKVVVLERSQTWGGRASTQVKQDVQFNMGAHALYCHGHAFRILSDLKIPFTGHYPNGGLSTVLTKNAEYPLPVSLRSVLFSRFLTLREKWRLLSFFKRLPRIDAGKLANLSISEWIAEYAGHGRLNQLLRTLFRLGTFVADADRMSAGAAIEQLQIGNSGNVWYVDGGWQTMIDGLRARATEVGVEFRAASSAEAVVSVGGGVSVQLAGGETLRAHTAVLAVPPQSAAEILQLTANSPFVRWLASCHPVHAACLDVALSQLSRPDHRFTLGLESPVYFSVHSAAAKLAPEGTHVVHLLKYLSHDSVQSPSGIKAELEGTLDRTQPGWRAHVVHSRYLPNMVVSYAIPTSVEGGLKGRPEVAVAGHPGVFLVGDWVGGRGQLADAAAASAEEAANAVLQRLTQFDTAVVGSNVHAQA